MHNLYIFAGCLATLFGLANSVTTQCNLPSDLWCDTPEIRKICKTEALCEAYNKTVEKQKVNLTVIYETLCPYCQNFTRFILYPKVWKNLQSIVNIQMVPYGNAKQKKVNGTWTFTCQNGIPPQAECFGNIVQNCVIYHLPKPSVYMPFVNCLESSLATKCSSHCNPQAVDAVAQDCYKKQGFSKDTITQLTTCVKGPEGIELMHKSGVITDSLWPQKHRYTPWFFINNASTIHQQEYKDILDKFICASYRGPPDPPKYCQQ